MTCGLGSLWVRMAVRAWVNGAPKWIYGGIGMIVFREEKAIDKNEEHTSFIEHQARPVVMTL